MKALMWPRTMKAQELTKPCAEPLSIGVVLMVQSYSKGAPKDALTSLFFRTR